MATITQWSVRVALIAPMLAIACADNPLQVADTAAAPKVASHASVASSELLKQQLSEDPVMLELATSIPGFAGLYFNESGILEMALTDTSHAPMAVVAAVSRVGPYGVSAAELLGVTVRQAEYGFLELASKRARLRPHLFRIRGVSSVAVDERENRIRVSLADPSVEPEVRVLLQRLAIPEESVVFWQASYATEASVTLQEGHPNGYIQGGWRIGFSCGGQWSACTLGFPAIQPDGQWVFVTNSHCTATPYGYDGEPIYYGTSWSIAGHEILDPQPFSCGLYQQCRDADVALISPSPTREIAFGTIARPTGSSGCSDCAAPLTVDLPNPLQITGKRTGVLTGQTLHKIGSSTGWTYGEVVGTCEDWAPTWTGYGVTKLCSDRFAYSSWPGDSGAPVFILKPTGDVDLVGLHWGRTLPVGWPYSHGLVSSLRQIERDLSRKLAVYDSGPPTFQIEGPSRIRPGQVCTWTAVGNGIPMIVGHQWTGALSGSGYMVTGTLNQSDWLQITAYDGWGRQGYGLKYIEVDPEEEGKACLDW